MAIPLSTHNIQFHDEKVLNMCFVELSEEFRRASKRVRISHGKIAIELLRFDSIYKIKS